MPKKPTADPAQAKAQAVAALVQLWRENPFHYFTRGEIGLMFNIGEKSMTNLVAMGAPVVAEKVSPDHFKAWLWEKREEIGKLTV